MGKKVRRTGAAVALPLLALTATLRCAEDDPFTPPPAVPGNVTFALVSPNGAEGAVLVEIDASAPIVNVTSDSSSVFLDLAGGALRVVLARSFPGTLRMTLELADTAAALEPRVIEVADGSNQLRPSLAGYRFEVVP